jgi:succinylarginine dihydrolase
LRVPGSERLLLFAPLEVAETASSRAVCDSLIARGGPVGEVSYVDLRESMQNGGGPACLRLRVVHTEADRAAANPRLLLDAPLHARLVAWVERYHREELGPDDLGDPALLVESHTALDELSGILGLGGSYYDFQRV